MAGWAGLAGAPSEARRGWAGQPIPRRQAQRVAPQARSIDTLRRKKCAAPKGGALGINGRSIRRRRYHRLQLIEHAWLDKDASLLGRDRHVEHLSERRAPQMRHAARPVGLLGLQSPIGP